MPESWGSLFEAESDAAGEVRVASGGGRSHCKNLHLACSSTLRNGRLGSPSNGPRSVHNQDAYSRSIPKDRVRIWNVSLLQASFSNGRSKNK